MIRFKKFIYSISPYYIRRIIDNNSKIKNASYNEDSLLVDFNHNCDFLNEERFKMAYEAGKSTGSWGGMDIRWRAYTVCWAANRASILEGDFVECGVNRGGYSLTLIKYLNFSTLNKRLFLLDTYCGLDERYVTESEKQLGILDYQYDECYNAVCETFKGYNNVHIIRGVVPETLNQVDSMKISFLSIDMNCLNPEIEALKYFWDKIVPGGVVVFDDYGFKTHTLQKKAFDEFAKTHNTQVLCLPTGQGLIIK